MVRRLAAGMAYCSSGEGSRRMRLKQILDVFCEKVDFNIDGIAH